MMMWLGAALFIISAETGKIIIDITSPSYKPVRISVESEDKKIEEIIRKNLSIIGYVELSDKPDVKVSIRASSDDEFVLQATMNEEKSPFLILKARGKDKEKVANELSNHLISKIAGVKTDIFGRTLYFLSNLEGKKEIFSVNFISGKIEKVVSAKSFIPSFSVSDDGSKIAFTHYDGKNYSLYILDAVSRKIYSTTLKTGNFLFPTFVNQSILIVPWNSGEGGSNLYVLNLNLKKFQKISSGNSDVLGKTTPDGKKIIFVSGREGLPQIFIKDIGTGEEKKIPLSGRYNSSPDISPDGKDMVFTKLEGNKFNIYIYNFETGQEKKIIDFGSSENPTWTPDGNFIIFSSNADGDYDLYITDKFGSFRRKILDTKKDEIVGFIR
jgi:TolB protein